MKSKLFKNIGFLTISQAANYVIPLITIPYITRVVGIENFGLLEFATVAISYLSAVVVYGFNTSATRKIAALPEDINHVSRVFTRVLLTRMVLFLLMSIVFIVCLYFIPEFREEQTLMLFAFPMVLGWSLYPDFLFQGLQKLEVLALSNFIIKSLAALLIFSLLNSKEDFYLVAGINSMAQVLVGFGMLIYALRSINGLHFVQVKFKNVIIELKDGIYIFLAQFFGRVYAFSSIIFLGFLLTNSELGMYSAGLKLIVVAQSFLFLPLFGALFPYLSNLFQNNRKTYKAQFSKAFKVTLLVSGISSLVLFTVPQIFVKLVFGEDYLGASDLLRIMSPMLISTAVVHFCTQQGIIIFKKDKWNLVVVVSIGLLSIVLNFVLIPVYGLFSAAWIRLGVDFLFALMAVMMYRVAFRQLSEKTN